MKRIKHRMKMTLGERIFVTINYLLLALIFIIMLYPLIYVVSASFSNPSAVSSGRMLLWPIEPSLEGYQLIFKYKEIWTGYANTIFYTVVGTLCNLAVTLPCAYALSRKDLKGRGILTAIFMFTMYFSGGLIPAYINFNNFHMLDTRSILIVNGLVSVYNLIVARTFFANTIPWELQEAAYLDGCSHFKLFARIVIPLSAPIIVVLMLYYGVSHWNQYFNAMIYLRDRSKFPLQVILKEILTQSQLATEAMLQGGLSPEDVMELQRMGEKADMMKYGVIVIASLPMMIVYPWLQKFFAKGIMIGSVKG